MGTPEVHQYMTVGAYAVTCDQPVTAARRVMREHEIRHLPVLQSGTPVGVLSARDLHFLERLPGVSDDITVDNVMTPGPYFVRPDTAVSDAAAEMARRKVGSAIVVQSGKVVGMFTVIDALRALVRLTAPAE